MIKPARLALICWSSFAAAQGPVREGPGERLDPRTHGPTTIESMDRVASRLARSADATQTHDARNPHTAGEWYVPSRRAMGVPHSGRHQVINRFGDPCMGIQFPEPAFVEGAWFTAGGTRGVSAHSVQAVGFRSEVPITRSSWSPTLGPTPIYLPLCFDGVDRIEIHARGRDQRAWLAMDDLE